MVFGARRIKERWILGYKVDFISMLKIYFNLTEIEQADFDYIVKEKGL